MMSPTAKVPFYWGSHTEGIIGGKTAYFILVAIGRNNFLPFWAEGEPDFTSRRRQFDLSQLRGKGTIRQFKKSGNM
jgi:hypothetical protein